ncbi:MAG TPA: enoyl-CoA hydratase-related protein [Steroidobacteraceae bacterium]|nr:enoyl-CoA hydratase-related protein [Steroidobacteraceae bacterium]
MSMEIDPTRYRHVRFTRQGRILTAALNREQALNAVDAALHEELSRLFTDLEADEDSDVLVLTGTGRAFCAGGDLPWLQSAIDDPAVFERTAVEGKAILFRQLELTKPIIARLNGPAVGLGASLALFCDIIVAAQSAMIADPHVSVGLVAGDGGAIIWPQLVGYARAKEYLLTGAQISAQEAERIGLINRVVPDAQLDATVQELAQRLAAGALKAIKWTKIATNLPLKKLAHEIFDAAVAYEMLSNRTQDHREAIAAFRERRKPVFVGR